MDKLGVKLAWVFAAAFVGATIMGFIPNPLVGEGAGYVALSKAKQVPVQAHA